MKKFIILISIYNDWKSVFKLLENIDLQIAEIAQQKWNDKYKSKISFVLGDEWIAGNLSYHLKSRPIWISSILPFTEHIKGEGVKRVKIFGKLKYIFDSDKSKLKDNVITLREDNFTLIGFK